MREAIRQGLTSFTIFIGVIVLVQFGAHSIYPSFPLVPSDERAFLLAGIAVMFAVFSGLSKARAS
jgi:hypothetical protein